MNPKSVFTNPVRLFALTFRPLSIESMILLDLELSEAEIGCPPLRYVVAKCEAKNDSCILGTLDVRTGIGIAKALIDR